ncbi:MAG: hypothetical protein MHM6MM_002049 [Cercozoa sp. M6MM]
MEQYDPDQVAMMEEKVIVIDENDTKIGHGSKKDTHQTSAINNGLLHRAFSVFLFDNEGRLSLQQRALEKITFPGMWTNTCCSHPLNLPGEEETSDDLDQKIEGVKNAARRKLEQELGIPADTFSNNDFHFITRLHYKAVQDETWSEHEIDYVLFIQADVQFKPNPNEVMDARYFSKDELVAFVDDVEAGKHGELKITPWFRLIMKNFLFPHWDKLAEVTSGSLQRDEAIHRLL